MGGEWGGECEDMNDVYTRGEWVEKEIEQYKMVRREEGGRIGRKDRWRGKAIGNKTKTQIIDYEWKKREYKTQKDKKEE